MKNVRITKTGTRVKEKIYSIIWAAVPLLDLILVIFLLSLLFITLLRNYPPMAGSFFKDNPPCFLAKARRGASAFYSSVQGRPGLLLRQGGQLDTKVRGVLNGLEGGPASRDAGRPAL